MGDNKEMVLGEVDSSGMPIPFIRFMLREPCNRIIIGGFSDGESVGISGSIIGGEMVVEGWDCSKKEVSNGGKVQGSLG